MAGKRHRTQGAARTGPPAGDDRYRAIMQAAADAIITISEQGIVLDYNAAAQQIFGYAGGEVLGRNVSMLMPEPYSTQHDSYLERYVRSRETRVLGRIRAVHGRRKNGELFPMELSLAECAGPDGAVFIGVLRDLSDLAGAESEARLYGERLQQRTQELEFFTATATHDLTEPLRKVQYYVDRLRTLVADHGGARERDSLDHILAATRRMQALVDDVGAFAATAYSGQATAPTDLGQLVRDGLATLEGRIDELGATIEIGPLPTLEVEVAPMRRVFENLVSNALKYHRRDVAPVVRISATQRPTAGPPAQAWWEIRVQDNGIGIAPEYHDRIFGLFKRLHSRAEYPGSGVGLALCRHVVERHQGVIAVQSAAGQGATFTIALPCGPTAEERGRPAARP